MTIILSFIILFYCFGYIFILFLGAYVWKIENGNEQMRESILSDDKSFL